MHGNPTMHPERAAEPPACCDEFERSSLPCRCHQQICRNGVDGVHQILEVRGWAGGFLLYFTSNSFWQSSSRRIMSSRTAFLTITTLCLCHRPCCSCVPPSPRLLPSCMCVHTYDRTCFQSIYGGLCPKWEGGPCQGVVGSSRRDLVPHGV